MVFMCCQDLCLQYLYERMIFLKDLTLVVLAAGMGSRFGGLKQLEPIGKNGEVILDYSIHDAVKAGFTKVVFIIKEEHQKDFDETVGKRCKKIVDVEYVYQNLNDLPEGFSVPDERVKPWGTAHALLCAKENVNTPFAVINADDYYGSESMQIIAKHLLDKNTPCMVGFPLGNTLTENGTVSRGVCEAEDGYLKKITEHTKIDKDSGIPLDTLVSMNLWGLQPDIFPEIERGICDFLKNMTNPLKDEYFIPLVIDELIKAKDYKVKMLMSPAKWYGMTYKEDLPSVKNALGNIKIYD